MLKIGKGQNVWLSLKISKKYDFCMTFVWPIKKYDFVWLLYDCMTSYQPWTNLGIWNNDITFSEACNETQTELIFLAIILDHILGISIIFCRYSWFWEKLIKKDTTDYPSTNEVFHPIWYFQTAITSSKKSYVNGTCLIWSPNIQLSIQ